MEKKRHARIHGLKLVMAGERKDQEREYEQDRGKISAANWCQRMTMLIIPRQACKWSSNGKRGEPQIGAD